MTYTDVVHMAHCQGGHDEFGSCDQRYTLGLGDEPSEYTLTGWPCADNGQMWISELWFTSLADFDQALQTLAALRQTFAEVLVQTDCDQHQHLDEDE